VLALLFKIEDCSLMTSSTGLIFALAWRDFTKLPTPIWGGLAGSFLMLLLLYSVGQVPLSYNIRNLTVRWKTTVMTGLAFTLVLGLLTVMLAFVAGMKRMTEQSGHPENVMVMSDGATDESFSSLGFSDIGDIETQPGVEKLGDKWLCSKETYLVANQPVDHPQSGRPDRRFLQIRGIDDPEISAQVHRVELFPDSAWFSGAGVQAVPGKETPAIEVVLGEAVARELGNDRLPEVREKARNPKRLDVGDTFEMAERTFVVSGVMKSSGSTFDSEVWGKRSVLGKKFGKETYTTLLLKAKNAQEAKSLTELLKNYTKAALNAQLETKYFDSLNATNIQFTIAILFVTVFIAIGGVFGVMNTMYAAISQRIKDIGVLRLVGFSRMHILISFLLESLVIAMVGGAVGCAVGSLVDGFTASSVLSAGAGGGFKTVSLRLTVDAFTLSCCFLLTVIMGFIGGFLPAFSAVRLKPLEALR
jgi:putative ABC transport system permease protein